MANSYTSLFVHFIFSTKNRQKLIADDLKDRLWAYMGGIARENKMKPLAIGGIEDHVHLLVPLPSTLAVAKAIQFIKGGSSKWVHDTFPRYQYFKWQDGYGAFTVSVSRIEDTVTYINEQKEYHRSRSFQEEYLAFLKKHGIEYDEQYIWG